MLQGRRRKSVSRTTAALRSVRLPTCAWVQVDTAIPPRPLPSSTALDTPTTPIPPTRRHRGYFQRNKYQSLMSSKSKYVDYARIPSWAAHPRVWAPGQTNHAGAVASPVSRAVSLARALRLEVGSKNSGSPTCRCSMREPVPPTYRFPRYVQKWKTAVPDLYPFIGGSSAGQGRPGPVRVGPFCQEPELIHHRIVTERPCKKGVKLP